ncbi:gamma-glutamylcyclotransferase family protein [Mycoplasma phocoeninasale]|uniref:gamma-glutamylcyclotransferase family protein n=1 Tax=Mycoplasma phocoeninasale TaxID=2726117 RepID=UPI0019681BD4|nr:gamma-glutamylcyclotransferase family protein [Mycoplasma phocoeninasale]MBN0970496.1 gamma-glutamylcyclotransferase [Mycoplasma phocoeninasale]
MKTNNETNKIYLFAYDEMKDLEFFTKLFGMDVVHQKARLTGFVKCVNEDGEFFIRRDATSYLEGLVFELNKEQLFFADKWKLLPIYDRFLVNVELTETNEILENVYVYSKIESGNYRIAKKEDENQQKDVFLIQNFIHFLTIQKRMKQYNLYDFLFIYKIDNETKKYYENISNPNAFISFHDTKARFQTSIIPCVLVPFSQNNENYVAITIFNRNDYFNAITYYEMFYGLGEYKNIMVELTATDKKIDLAIFKNKKPDFIFSMKEDKKNSEKKFAEYEKAFELVVPEFEIEHWNRFNYLISFFFNKK